MALLSNKRVIGKICLLRKKLQQQEVNKLNMQQVHDKETAYAKSVRELKDKDNHKIAHTKEISPEATIRKDKQKRCQNKRRKIETKEQTAYRKEKAKK